MAKKNISILLSKCLLILTFVLKSGICWIIFTLCNVIKIQRHDKSAVIICENAQNVNKSKITLSVTKFIIVRWMWLNILSSKPYPSVIPGLVSYLIKDHALHDLCGKMLGMLSSYSSIKKR